MVYLGGFRLRGCWGREPGREWGWLNLSNLTLYPLSLLANRKFTFHLLDVQDHLHQTWGAVCTQWDRDRDKMLAYSGACSHLLAQGPSIMILAQRCCIWVGMVYFSAELSLSPTEKW